MSDAVSPDAPRNRAGEALREDLMRRLAARQVRVGIIGLGYVGLPLALAFAERGVPVLGFDTDAAKVAALAGGTSYIRHVAADAVARAVAARTLEASADFDRLGEPEALLICVPTPLDSHRQPDLSFVESTAGQIARRLRRGQLVVLESTTYPGTTDEVLLPILEESGLGHGRDFFLAFSPEREDPGNPTVTTTAIPKVVGGVDATAGDLAEALYALVFERTVRVASSRIAEAAKLTENVFRAVNIALVNELKTVFEAMGVDVWEALAAAETKPFGYMRFNPGPGWGGHCIPVDPFYLAWKARQYGQRARFVELAGEVNREMPRYVVAKLETALNARGKSVHGSSVLILGIAYKPNVADPRESPAFEIIAHLVALGAEVAYHDPHIPQAPRMRSWPDLPPLDSVPLEPGTVGRQDAVVVVTDHAGIDYRRLAEWAALIVDTRGVYREPRPNVVRA